MQVKSFSRRKFFNKCASVGAAFFGSAVTLAACNSDPTSVDSESVQKDKGDLQKSCDDMSGVSNEELDKRESLGYVTKSQLSDSYCGTCGLFIPGADKNCGECLLFKGPVYAQGYCVQFAPKIKT